MEDGEKEETAGEEQAKVLWAEATKKKKRRRGQKVEKPEAFMANFFKGLEIYQTKLLVSAPAQAAPLGQELAQGNPQRNDHSFVSQFGWLCFLTFSFLFFSSSHLSACSSCVGGKAKEVNLAKAKCSSSPARLRGPLCPVLS